MGSQPSAATARECKGNTPLSDDRSRSARATLRSSQRENAGQQRETAAASGTTTAKGAPVTRLTSYLINPVLKPPASQPAEKSSEGKLLVNAAVQHRVNELTKKRPLARV